eukprot:gene12247-8433_t
MTISHFVVSIDIQTCTVRHTHANIFDLQNKKTSRQLLFFFLPFLAQLCTNTISLPPHCLLISSRTRYCSPHLNLKYQVLC